MWLQKNSFDSAPWMQDFKEIYAFLEPISSDYPNFKEWFDSKVVPGLIGGSRHLVTIRRMGDIAAIGIAKNEECERKLCTIRVAKEFEGRGLGIRVLDQLMEWLDTDRPLATVSEEKIKKFEHIFSRYGFELSCKEFGLYRAGKAEFIFNKPKLPILKCIN